MSVLGAPGTAAATSTKPRSRKKRAAPKGFTIDGERYTTVKRLGQGSYGTVEKVEDPEGNEYAVKRVEYKKGRGVYPDIIKEMDILKRFGHHPNVIGLCGYAWRDRDFLVLMEYGGMPLHRFVRVADEGERLAIVPVVAWQLATALAHLHRCGVAHRDLKPDNVLIQEYELADGRLVPYVRVCDFGLSKHMALKRNTPKTSTLWYRAPENLMKLSHYDHKIDVWALGCVLYEFVTGDVLFQGANSHAVMLKILSCLGPVSEATSDRLQLDRLKRPKRWRKHLTKSMPDKQLDALIRHMLEVNPATRPSARQVLDHAYFRAPRHAGSIERVVGFLRDEEAHRHECTRDEEAHRRECARDDETLAGREEPVASGVVQYSPDVRRALVQWLLKLQRADRDDTHPQTVFLAIELFDDVMSRWGPIEADTELKHVAIVCLNLASKYLESGLDLEFVYLWNNERFYRAQGVPRRHVPTPTADDLETFVVALDRCEQRCLRLLDFCIGGRHTALDRAQGNYPHACQLALQQSEPDSPEVARPETPRPATAQPARKLSAKNDRRVGLAQSRLAQSRSASCPSAQLRAHVAKQYSPPRPRSLSPE